MVQLAKNSSKVWDIEGFPKLFFSSLYNFVLLNTQNSSPFHDDQFFNHSLFWFWWLKRYFWLDIVQLTKNSPKMWNIDSFPKMIFYGLYYFVPLNTFHFPKFITFPCRRSIFNHFLFLVLMPAKAFLVGYGTTSPNYPKVWDIESYLLTLDQWTLT